MICTGSEYEVPTYKEYRNRTMAKYLNKFGNQLIGLKSCSLKPEDKEKIRAALQKMLNEIR